jgi:hypothetical protein
MSSEKDDLSYEPKSVSRSLSRKGKPIFKNIVNRLQIASRLARSERSVLEEENDVIADDNEIKNIVRQNSHLSSKHFSRPKPLTLRQLSKLSDGGNRNLNNRRGSKISDLSLREEDEFEGKIICDGIVHFWKHLNFDEVFICSKNKKLSYNLEKYFILFERDTHLSN